MRWFMLALLLTSVACTQLGTSNGLPVYADLATACQVERSRDDFNAASTTSAGPISFWVGRELIRLYFGRMVLDSGEVGEYVSAGIETESKYAWEGFDQVSFIAGETRLHGECSVPDFESYPYANFYSVTNTCLLDPGTILTLHTSGKVRVKVGTYEGEVDTSCLNF